MSKKNIEKGFEHLEWYAYRVDINSHKFEPFNVIREDLMHDLIRLDKTKDYCYEDIKNTIKGWAMYHYSYKAEHEFVVQDLFGNDIAKVDVWQQIEPNLERLTDYIIGECFL